MPATGPSSYGLRLGRVVVELTSPEPAFADFLTQYFGRPGDPEPATVSVDVDIARDETPRAVPNSLLLTKSADGREFDIDGGLIRGSFDRDSGCGRVTVRSTLLRGQMMRVFEQLIYQMFQSAVQRSAYRAVLVHSAGVIRDGRGYLFVGPSGVGKSTLARLSGAHTVLNDEMNLVETDGDGPTLVGTPFNGFFAEKSEGRAPLAAVLLLEQGPDHLLAPADPAATVTAVAAEVVPPIGLADPVPAMTRATMIDLAADLLECVPVHRLRFRPDAGFWDVIPR